MDGSHLTHNPKGRRFSPAPGTKKTLASATFLILPKIHAKWRNCEKSVGFDAQSEIT